MSITTLEPVTIDHLDFEPEQACECDTCRVGHPTATHIVIPHMFCACFDAIFACADCVRRWRELMLAGADQLSCNRCGKSQPKPLRDLLEIRPL